jgi:hypothetical protein
MLVNSEPYELLILGCSCNPSHLHRVPMFPRIGLLEPFTDTTFEVLGGWLRLRKGNRGSFCVFRFVEHGF